MNLILKTAIFTLLFFLHSAFAWTPKTMIVFGDSLSDNGNKYASYRIPLSPPYWHGRYTNGPVWIENLAYQLQLIEDPQANPDYPRHESFKDYAFGNSVILKKFVQKDTPTLSLRSQVEQYLKTSNEYPDLTLFVIFEGANDLVFPECLANPFQCTQDMVEEEMSVIHLLHHQGARHFLIPLMPNLSLTPALANSMPPHQKKEIAQLVKYFNNELVIALEQFHEAHVHTQFITIDTGLFLHSIKSEFSQPFSTPCYDNKNIYDKVAGNICDEDQQDDYVFWDTMHPTRKINHLFASKIFETIQKQVEPDATDSTSDSKPSTEQEQTQDASQ